MNDYFAIEFALTNVKTQAELFCAARDRHLLEGTLIQVDLDREQMRWAFRESMHTLLPVLRNPSHPSHAAAKVVEGSLEAIAEHIDLFGPDRQVGDPSMTQYNFIYTTYKKLVGLLAQYGY